MNLGFIVSSQRAGSNWLMRSLSQHPEVFATELRLFGRHCELWENSSGVAMPRMTGDQYVRALAGHYNTEDLTIAKSEFIDEFSRDYFEFLIGFTRRYANKPVVIDKVTPFSGTTQVIRRGLRKYFPAAKSVRLVRDCRDVLTSCALSEQFNRALRPTISSEGPSLLQRLFDDNFLRTWSEHWVESSRLLPANTPLVLFEEMSVDHAGVLRRLFDYFEVDNDDAIVRRCAERTTFARLSQEAERDLSLQGKIRKGQVGDWRSYFTRRDGELVEEIAGECLCGCGYESSSDWIQALPERLEMPVPKAVRRAITRED